MSTGISSGFISENSYYSLLNYKDIFTDTRIAPKYYSIRPGIRVVIILVCVDLPIGLTLISNKWIRPPGLLPEAVQISLLCRAYFALQKILKVSNLS